MDRENYTTVREIKAITLEEEARSWLFGIHLGLTTISLHYQAPEISTDFERCLKDKP